MTSRFRIVEVDGIPMSALVQEAERPRAVVLALHGGATSSVYYDAPDHPRLSLLRAGAALGFTVIALDRPGYGASAPYRQELTSAARRVDLAFGALERLPGSSGAGVFLMAHSSGCELAIRMAGDERGADLLGLEIAGTGRHRHERAMRLWREWDRERPAGPALREILWGPPRIYPDDLVGGARIAAPAPSYEGTEAEGWPEGLAELASRVRVPVHYSLGEHEMWWRAGAGALADVASLFTASPRVAVHEQVGGGHNLSLGRCALAYHLEILSFVEECVLAREAVDRERVG
ncbi:alpha/beta hydrolase [Actinocorallia populi]|uniref:alpha/beta hydrolase n=1 Tax=Actinocorallia populi TaxID=2079200 RepID=UPI000D088AE5|nr:alpha/beta fold hydrolase [Actinocorallia populi]